MYAPKQYRPERRKPESNHLALEDNDHKLPIIAPPTLSLMGGEDAATKESGTKQPASDAEAATQQNAVHNKKQAQDASGSETEQVGEEKTKSAPKKPAGKSEHPPQFKLHAGAPFQFKMAEAPLQMKAASGAKGAATAGNSSSNGLPEEVKSQMEGAFGTSFDDVKVTANSSVAKDAGALAFAQGSNIHFAPGQFSPNTKGGQELLGHELAHVVQQRQGRVQANAEVNGLAVNNDKGLEAEADQLGAKAAQFKASPKGGVEKNATNPKSDGAAQMKLAASAAPVVQAKFEDTEALSAEPPTPMDDMLALDGFVGGEKPHEEKPAKDSAKSPAPKAEGNGTAKQETGEQAEGHQEVAAETTENEERAGEGGAKEDQEAQENEAKEVETAENGLAADAEAQPHAENEVAGKQDESPQADHSHDSGEVAQLAPDPNAGKSGFGWGDLTYIVAPVPALGGLALEQLSKGAASILDKTSAPDWLKNGAKSASGFVQSINQTFKDLSGELFEGAIMGDFKEDPTIMNMVGQVLMGLVPYAGQVADARDTVKAVMNLTTDGGWKDGGNWLNFGLTILAWVPLLGDGVKVASKIGKLKNVSKALGKLEPLIKGIKSGWGKVTKFLGPKIAKFTTKMADGWKSLKTAAAKKFETFKSSVSSGISKATNWLKAKWESLKNAASSAWTKAKEAISTGAQKLKTAIESGAKKVAKIVSEAPQKLINRVKATWDKAASYVQKAKDLAKGAVNKVKSKFVKLKDRLQKKYRDWKKKESSPKNENSPSGKNEKKPIESKKPSAGVLDELYETQKRIVADVESGKLKLTTSAQKGNYGEMKADIAWIESGKKPLHERVTDLNAPTKKGIDHVYLDPGPPPINYIVESKFGSSRLSTLVDKTRQMSKEWIEDRLIGAVGKKKAIGIIKEGYTSVLAKVKPDGTISYKLLDKKGLVVGQFSL